MYQVGPSFHLKLMEALVCSIELSNFTVTMQTPSTILLRMTVAPSTYTSWTLVGSIFETERVRVLLKKTLEMTLIRGIN